MAYAVPIAVFLHLVGVIVWVGGMTLAHFCLRPALADLSPQLRLPVAEGVFSRFFNLVGTAIILILLSGGYLFPKFGGAQAPWPVHAMVVIGIVMMLIYGHIRFATFPKLRRAVQAQKWPEGAIALGRIRRLVVVNLVLGYVTVALATLAR
ncbi:CopD family protein [Chitinasiproducens palmae]|uniref:Uncharacterized membrane protein n=1 Tax=Chitinasiproducens palmae TaxID=1770053 RepID=A0A1H2PVI1_9BURK|nr:CopD family protein [Chitinasiproducens palmae]SDV50925.1 Uncharacterized membrane protein [Chitinasiproducens palmae]